jgi:hypothetical protein
MAQLYPQALGSIFVSPYDSQGYGGGVRTRLHAWHETHYVSATKTSWLILFRETIVVYSENHMKPIHCVGRIQCFNVLKQMVYIATTGLYRVNSRKNFSKLIQ